jgi:hypothetical protein
MTQKHTVPSQTYFWLMRTVRPLGWQRPTGLAAAGPSSLSLGGMAAAASDPGKRRLVATTTVRSMLAGFGGHRWQGQR